MAITPDCSISSRRHIANYRFSSKVLSEQGTWPHRRHLGDGVPQTASAGVAQAEQYGLDLVGESLARATRCLWDHRNASGRLSKQAAPKKLHCKMQDIYKLSLLVSHGVQGQRPCRSAMASEPGGLTVLA